LAKFVRTTDGEQIPQRNVAKGMSRHANKVQRRSKVGWSAVVDRMQLSSTRSRRARIRSPRKRKYASEEINWSSQPQGGHAKLVRCVSYLPPGFVVYVGVALELGVDRKARRVSNAGRS
jgi:hypothetical protein